MVPDGTQSDGRFLADLDVTLDLPLASVGSRALAQLIDLEILVIVLLGMLALLALAARAVPGAATVALVGVPIVVFLLYWGFFVTCELMMEGQTPGKRLFRLRVVNDDGTTLGLAGALVRNLLRPVDFLPFAYGIGALAIVLNRRGKRIGDLAAGTVVVHERRPVEPIAVLRWPEGLSAEDAALIEESLRRGPGLLPERRDELAAEIIAWLDREYAPFAAARDAALPAWESVERLFLYAAER